MAVLARDRTSLAEKLTGASVKFRVAAEPLSILRRRESAAERADVRSAWPSVSFIYRETRSGSGHHGLVYQPNERATRRLRHTYASPTKNMSITAAAIARASQTSPEEVVLVRSLLTCSVVTWADGLP